jgi:hypothetical protein
MIEPSEQSISLQARIRYRFHLGDAIRDIVLFTSDFNEAIEHVALPEVDLAVFKILLGSKLDQL